MLTAESKHLPAPDNLPDASLVFGVCLFLLAIIVIFIAVRIPRLLALFGISFEWIDGFILHYVPGYVPHPKRHGHSPENKLFVGSLDDIIFQYSDTSERPLLFEDRVRDMMKRYPPHIPSLPKALRPLLKPFRTRISPGFSFGQLLILVAYFAILLYATLYNSNVFLDHSRTGWIAISQYPFVYAFAQKNNFIGSLLGFGYEKVGLARRWSLNAC
jgi:ferric-chelate reductase